jgi:DNA-binding NarL/FixJ family response regulator
VLVLTLDESTSVRRAALAAGADHFLFKDRLDLELPALLARLGSARDQVFSPLFGRCAGRYRAGARSAWVVKLSA